MRRPALITAALAICGLIGLGVTALVDNRTEAFTLGVPIGVPIALHPGDVACQLPIAVPEGADFAAVRFSLGTNRRPGPALAVLVRDARTHKILGRGGLAAGYPDVNRAPSHTVKVGHVAARRTIAVCLADRGARTVFVYGNAAAASRTSHTTINGRVRPLDIDLRFERAAPQSMLQLLPTVIQRAALFRPSWVGAWTYVALAVLVFVVVPALLVQAITAAARREGRGSAERGAA